MVSVGNIINGLFLEALELSRFLTKAELLSQHSRKFSSYFDVNLPKDLKQWCLKDRLPEKRKSVNYNHNMKPLIKTPIEVVTVFPDDRNPLFYPHSNSQESLASSYNASSCSETIFKSCTAETLSAT